MNNPFINIPVAVVGDVMLDRYIYGSVDRISPEAPVPVVQVNNRKTMLGGAGNVAANLVALGATPLLVGRIGRDETASAFIEISEKGEIPTTHLLQTDVPTTSKTRVVAQNQQVVRMDEEVNTPLKGDDLERFINHLKSARMVADVVIVSDYAKGLIDSSMMQIICDLWADGTVLVDPKPRRAIDYTGATSMTPNLKEAIELLREDSIKNTDDAVVELGLRLVEKFDLEHILITRSEKGMSLIEKSGAVHHRPAQAIEVFDVSGAGDTVMATFASSIAAGLTLDESLKYANAAGGVVVGKLGTATVNFEEINAFLQGRN